MRNYHIVIDHAFVAGFINDVATLGLLENNTFWVRGFQSEAHFLQAGEHIEWVGNNYILLAERLNKLLQPTDKIFLHWYDLPLKEFVMNLLPSAVVYNCHWGGELLEEPYLYHAKRNYAPRTLSFIQQEVDDEIKGVLKQRNFPYIPFFWIYKLRNYIRVQKKFILKRQSVKRLQYNISHPANTGDERLAVNLYNHPQLKFLPGFYDLNFDLAESKLGQTKTDHGNTLNILLNNAAHYSGNHLDAIDVLAKNIRPGQYFFHCPLSYGGSSHQIDKVILYGKEKLKDSFLPITELMPREKYVQFLDTIDVLFMYQNISQGFGNIIAALTQGKPVFLRRINSLTEMLTNIGIKVYDADSINDALIMQSIQEAKLNAERNRQILKDNFSTKTRLKFLQDLLLREN